MPVPQNMTDALKALDDATTAVGVKIDNLSAQIKTGMSQTEVDSVVGQLAAESAKLKGFAADPTDPVPPPPAPAPAV